VKFVDFQFDSSVWQEARAVLTEFFHRKCGFCESKEFATSHVNVSPFRPTRDALGLDGVSAPSHYHWLAYEWENLYPICEVCDRVKPRPRPRSTLPPLPMRRQSHSSAPPNDD
jgi:hypothetical protein